MRDVWDRRRIPLFPPVSPDPPVPPVLNHRKATTMIPIVSKHGGYRRTFAFGYVCLIYHATETFCERNYSFKNDPLGKPMRKVVAKKGRNAGNPFWACTGYPDCKGTRNWENKGGLAG